MNVTLGMAQDFKQAARRLLAAPLFTSFAVFSLAIGVAVTTAGYSVVDALFLRDLGIPEPARVVFVATPYEGRLLKGSISEPDFHDLAAAQRSFEAISASVGFQPSAALPSATEMVFAEAVEGAYFSTLHVAAARGRVLQPADDRVSALVVVLSDELWRTRFDTDPGIVGRTIRISGHPFEVVGVADAGFGGINGRGPGTKLWIPMSAHTSHWPAPVESTAARDRRQLVVVGRLAQGVAVETASAELSAIGRNLDEAFPSRDRRGPRASERPWRARSVAAINTEDNLTRRFGLTLVALISLVLVVACTNLANLVLARGTNRRHELAVRCALGGSRWRLVREQCAESVLLAAAGAAASYAVFQVLRVALDLEFNMAIPMGGRWTLAIQPALDVTAVTMAGAALLLSLLVFGLEPALQLTRTLDVRGVLAEGAAAMAPRARRQRTLLRWQVAVSAGFFIVATMFVRYTIAEARHDSGVEMQRLAVAVLNVRTPAWPEDRVRQVIDRVMQEGSTDPAITSIASSTGLPFGVPTVSRLSVAMTGAVGRGSENLEARSIAATPSIFQTLGVPIVRGRGFDVRDHAGAPRVVVVSELTARRVFGTTDAVGRELLLQGRAATVVGVARDTDVGSLLIDPSPFVYQSLAQKFDPFVTITVRAADDVTALRALRDALRRADPDLAVDMTGTARDVLAGPFVFLRAAGAGALWLGALTLLLAMVGLFGIQTHIVGSRTREIGLRMAMGASVGQIQAMVLKDGYRPVIEGLLLGVAGGMAGRVIVRSYLDIDVSVLDPWMIFAVPVPLIVAAFCACYLPARTAAAVDPNVALRHI